MHSKTGAISRQLATAMMKRQHARHGPLLSSVTISLTFINVVAYIDSCILTRALELLSGCAGQLLAEEDPVRCSVRSAHAEASALFQRILYCILFIYLLSNPKRVNQKPQWGEGCKEMDIDVKRQRIYFPLCALASHVSVHLFASWVF